MKTMTISKNIATANEDRARWTVVWLSHLLGKRITNILNMSAEDWEVLWRRNWRCVITPGFVVNMWMSDELISYFECNTVTGRITYTLPE